MSFDFRAREPGDDAFIFHSFLKSFRDAPAVAGIPNTLYYQGQHALIETLLSRAGVLMACSKEDPSQIYGYIVAERVPMIPMDATAVHWLYVKHTFRNLGIGKALYDAVVAKDTKVFYTHRQKNSERHLRARPDIVYNPYLLMGLKK